MLVQRSSKTEGIFSVWCFVELQNWVSHLLLTQFRTVAANFPRSLAARFGRAVQVSLAVGRFRRLTNLDSVNDAGGVVFAGDFWQFYLNSHSE